MIPHSSARPGSGLNSRWHILAVISLGVLATTIDSSASNIALPFIGRFFGAPLPSVTWVNLTYLLVVTGLLLSLGRLSDLVGRRRMYLAGSGLFTGMALLCGFAGSLPALIALRAGQAVGAAMMFTNSMAIITEAFPEQQRGQALGLAAAAISAGVALGPALGGLVLGALSWPAIFWMNVPLGMLTTAGAAAILPDDARRPADERMDWPGAALSMVAMSTLVVGLRLSPTDGLRAGLPLVVVAALATAAFIARERATAFPLLDLELFRNGTFRAATVASLLGYLALYIYVLLLPFFLIDYAALLPTLAGLILAAEPALSLIAGPPGGRLSDRLGSRLLVVCGLGITAGALWSLSRLTREASLLDIGWRVALVGLGVGLFYSPNSSALLGASPSSKLGVATGIASVARNLGMVSGLAVASAIISGTAPPGAADNGDFLYGFCLAMRLAAATCLLGLLTAAAWMRPPARGAAPLRPVPVPDPPGEP